MKRMNLRDVPDEVYANLVEQAQAHHQSLNAFVVDLLAEAARVNNIVGYLHSYQPPETGLTLEDAVAAVREVRDNS